MTISKSDVEELLKIKFNSAGWVVQRPEWGLRKKTFIASNLVTSYFIKFDINAELLIQVASIGVAPKVLHSGTLRDSTFVIQELISGIKPSREWLNSNAPKVFDLMGKYHSDIKLRSILSGPETKGDYKDYIENEIWQIDRRIQKLQHFWYKGASFAADYREFIGLGAKLVTSSLTPVHDEPNNSNFLLSDERLYLTDWDEARLGDPLHDIGPLLWWYFPISRWESLLNLQKVSFNNNSFHKIMWFAARSSMRASLFFAENGYTDDKGFINDFTEAVYLRANPRLTK